MYLRAFLCNRNQIYSTREKCPNYQLGRDDEYVVLLLRPTIYLQILELAQLATLLSGLHLSFDMMYVKSLLLPCEKIKSVVVPYRTFTLNMCLWLLFDLAYVKIGGSTLLRERSIWLQVLLSAEDKLPITAGCNFHTFYFNFETRRWKLAANEKKDNLSMLWFKHFSRPRTNERNLT